MILFLAANPPGTGRLALDREAHAIHVELKRSGYRDRFDFATRWAAEPLDLLRELRELKPIMVHFSGHGGIYAVATGSAQSANVVVERDALAFAPSKPESHGLYFHGEAGGVQLVSADAIAQTMEAAGGSVRVVVLNACYSVQTAQSLLAHVDCVVGMSGAIHSAAARSFAIGFYGGLGEHESVDAAFKQGRAAIHLGGLPDAEQPQLQVRDGFDASQLIPAAVPAPVLLDVPCPYPGMRSYTADDAGSFYGRDTEIAELMRRLRAGEREIFVIGPSGSGKSSLVTAGLLPRLARGASGLGSFVVRELRPGEQPTARLGQALDLPAGEPLVIADRVAALLAHRNPGISLLIVIDQLEELFTLASPDQRALFLDALRALGVERRCAVLFTLRADFFGALMESTLWKERRGQLSRIEVSPLSDEVLREAISAPARAVGVTVEPELIERLLADAASEPGILPLLQETLVQLWDARIEQMLTLADYERMGDSEHSGLAVALASRANASLRRLTAGQTDIARRILLRLVSFGEGRSDTRRQQARSALRAATDDAADFAYVLQLLIDDRLLTIDNDDLGGEPPVDLAHEILISAWPQLTEWIRSHRLGEQQRRRLEVRAAEWVHRDRGDVGLFDAIELAEAERWMAGETAIDLGYSDDLPRFLAASRQALVAAERQRQLALDEQERERRAADDERTRMRRRQTRFAIVALSLFSIGASITGLVIWQQRQAARLHGGRSEQELARSLIVDRHEPIAAIPHLLQAISLDVDSPTLRILLSTLRKSIWLVTLHTGGSVRSVAFSPDGARVITASDDGTAWLWDAATGASLGLPLKHDKAVNAASFSPDGAHVVTASDDGTARLWDAATGAPLGLLEHGAAVHTAAFSPDGARVVTAGGDGTARLWDAATGAPLGLLEHHRVYYGDYAKAVNVAAFSPDGARVITAGDDGFARLWDAATGAPLGLLEHHNTVYAAAFSPDGARVVTASDDGTARLWDAATGAPLGLPLKHDGPVDAAAFSPDGARVITVSFGGAAQLWDAATGAPLGLPLKHDGYVSAAAFSPDGARVVTASHDGTARLWDVASSSPIGLEHDDAVHAATFSPDGARVVTASEDGTARLWDAATGALLGLPLKHDGPVYAAAFSPDGARVVTASRDGTARLWDVVTGAQLGVPLKHDGFVVAAAFSPDGARVVTASHDGTARLWDVATGAPFRLVLKHDNAVRAVAFSPDGARVVTAGSDGAARLWDSVTGAPLGLPLKHDGFVSTAAFSPDGARVVTAGSDGAARLWDSVTGAPLGLALKHDYVVDAAAFSPDGACVVTVSWDRTAQLWDSATGASLGLPLKHDNLVHAASFSPDGARVVTVSSDATVRLWSVAETSAPTVWAQQVMTCLARQPLAPGASIRCPLAQRDETSADRRAQARSWIAVGDRATFSGAWTSSRRAYQRAIARLGPEPAMSSGTRDDEPLRLAVATRMALLAAIEDRMSDARATLRTEASTTDAVVLEQLAAVMHDDLGNDNVAMRLLDRAHRLEPRNLGILADLTEVYFAIGRYAEATRTLGQIDVTRASPDEQLALAVVAWAIAHMTGAPEADAARHVVRSYADLKDDAHIKWTWVGTNHALRYGSHRYEDVKLILNVIAVLVEPVSYETRAQLAELLGAR